MHGSNHSSIITISNMVLDYYWRITSQWNYNNNSNQLLRDHTMGYSRNMKTTWVTSYSLRVKTMSHSVPTWERKQRKLVYYTNYHQEYYHLLDTTKMNGIHNWHSSRVKMIILNTELETDFDCKIYLVTNYIACWNSLETMFYQITYASFRISHLS
jgi:hypothetical protein